MARELASFRASGVSKRGRGADFLGLRARKKREATKLEGSGMLNIARCEIVGIRLVAFAFFRHPCFALSFSLQLYLVIGL